MKAIYRTKGNRYEFHVDGAGIKDVFKGIAELQAIFEADDKCGLCGDTNLHLNFRVVDEGNYYELKCSKCEATFGFGQNKKGDTLFPKRNGKDGKKLANNGWSKYNKQEKNE